MVADDNANVGAEIMERGKISPLSRGPWREEPRHGWWGEDPPMETKARTTSLDMRRAAMTATAFATVGVVAVAEREPSVGKTVDGAIRRLTETLPQSR